MRQRGFELVKEEFRKHSGEIKLPQRATNKSSGYDFYCPIQITIEPHSSVLIASDVRAYMQDDEELLIFPRSSLGMKGIVIRNTIGKIDSDYYDNITTGGNIGISIWNTNDTPFTIEKGERICQGSFYKYLVADNDVPLSNKRIGGIGSTGK